MLYCQTSFISKVLILIPSVSFLWPYLFSLPLSAKRIIFNIYNFFFYRNRIFSFPQSIKISRLYSWTIMSDLKTTNTSLPLSEWINYLDLLLHSQFEWMIYIIKIQYQYFPEKPKIANEFFVKKQIENEVRRQHWPMQVPNLLLPSCYWHDDQSSWANRWWHVIAHKIDHWERDINAVYIYTHNFIF